jgi:PAS domain S-box-containing protein
MLREDSQPMAKSLKILLLEDEPLDEELIRNRLKQDALSFVLKRASSRKMFFKLLKEWNPDLVLSDFSLPDIRGDEALSYVKEHYPDLPFIILTATIGEETAVKCIKDGAWDYLMKHNLVRLVPAIRNAVSLKSERMTKESYKDQLLSTSEEFSVLIHTIEIHIWLLKDEDTYGAVNQAHASFFGMDQSKMENRKIREVLPRSAANILLKCNHEVYEKRKKIQKEEWISNDKGQKQCLYITLVPRKDRKGNIINVICTAEDITELIQKEESIRSSEEKYRRMFENTGSAIIILGDDGILSMCNDNFARLSGYRKGEIERKMHFLEFVAPVDRKRLLDYHQRRTNRKPAPAEYEFALLTKDGKEKQIFLQVALMTDTGTRIASLIDITTLKKVQNELINKEKELTALLEYSPIPQIYEDFSGPKKYIERFQKKGIKDLRKFFSENHEEYKKCRSLIKIKGQNKAFLELFKISSQEELESKLFEILTEDSIRMFVEGLFRIMEGDTVFESETLYHDAFGSEIIATTRWVVVPNHREELDMVVVSILDITRQRKAEEMEIQYRENLKLLSNNALEILEISTEEDLFLQIARQLHLLLGRAGILVSSYHSETGQMHVQTMVGFEDCYEALVQQTGLDIQNVIFEVPLQILQNIQVSSLQRIEGGISEASFGHISPGISHQMEKILELEEVLGMGFQWRGRLYGSALLLIRKGHHPIMPEIIEALVKQTSIALQRVKVEEQIKILSNAVDHSYAMVIITDLEGKIEYVNPRFLHVTGYTREEVLGKNPRILKSGNYRPDFYSTLWSTISAGGEWRGEFENRTKSGETYWVLTSISGVRNEKGEIRHYVAIEESITDRKRMEQELILAKDKAEESDRLKTAFLANLSHEIRTPLNAIAGFSELITQVDLGKEEQKEYFNIIRSNVSTLTKLIDDIIDFSKLELGQTTYEEAECSIDDIFRELRIYFLEEVKNLDKQIEIIIQPSSCTKMKIRSDNIRLRQILTNLLSNSVKFTQHGSIEMGCSIEQPGFVRFYVKDTGTGIPQEKIDMIFDRFRQADDTTTRQYGGTGLGLAISKGLVEMMGGEIWVNSILGKGTTFSFTIPYKPAAESSPSSGEGGKQIRPENGVDLSDKKILISDDDQSFRMLEEALKHTHAHLIHSREGADTIQACRDTGDLSLVLLDINLHDINGFEVAREIKKIRKDLPIIATTSFSMPDDYENSIAAGCVEYLTKPFQVPVLIETLKKIF